MHWSRAGIHTPPMQQQKVGRPLRDAHSAACRAASTLCVWGSCVLVVLCVPTLSQHLPSRQCLKEAISKIGTPWRHGREVARKCSQPGSGAPPTLPVRSVHAVACAERAAQAESNGLRYIIRRYESMRQRRSQPCPHKHGAHVPAGAAAVALVRHVASCQDPASSTRRAPLHDAVCCLGAALTTPQPRGRGFKT